MALTREEIKKKPGYVPYKKEFKWQKDLVAIRIPYFPQDGEPHVVCAGVNGVHYNVPRGVDVKVPRLVAENIRRKHQHQWAIGGRDQMTGMKYLGRLPRFNIYDLSGEAAERAVEIKPAAPVAAHEKLELTKQAVLAAQEDLQARVEISSAPVHEELLR